MCLRVTRDNEGIFYKLHILPAIQVLGVEFVILNIVTFSLEFRLNCD